MEKKTCTKCKIEKELNKFHKGHSGPNTYYSWCKLCKNKHSKENIHKYEETRQKWIKEYRKEYQEREKEKIKEYNKKYLEEHKEEFKTKRKIYNELNKDKIQEYYKNYLPKYIESGKRKESNDKYREKNKNNPQYKIRRNVGIRIYDALKRGYKKSKTSELLGCEILFYKLYLESLFLPGMTWENYGKVWEIDHLTPCDLFDLTDLEQQKICFNYKNTMPRFKTTEIAKQFGSDQIGNKNKKNKLL